MPKKVGFLYDQMLDKDFIRTTILNATKHKTHRYDIQKVLKNLDKYVDKTYDMILHETFVPTEPKIKRIYDDSSQKWRTIKIVPFWPDNVMHWLIVSVMKPVLMRGMYHWSCASIPKRGGVRVQKHIKHILKDDPKGTKYAGELDVKGYYPSISIHKLIWALARKIKDKKFLKLVYSILKSCGGGLAIGYYICQWMANFYLERIDHFIISLPGVKYMVRYMDNYTIFGPNKKKLHAARRDIEAEMKRSRDLTMKENWQIYPVRARKVSAVGYRYARGYTILRRRNFLRLTRQCRRVQKKHAAGKPIPFQQAAGIMSRIGQLKHCDSYKVMEKYVDPIQIDTIKEVISNESKRRLAAQRSLLTGNAA